MIMEKIVMIIEICILEKCLHRSLILNKDINEIERGIRKGVKDSTKELI